MIVLQAPVVLVDICKENTDLEDESAKPGEEGDAPAPSPLDLPLKSLKTCYSNYKCILLSLGLYLTGLETVQSVARGVVRVTAGTDTAIIMLAP